MSKALTKASKISKVMMPNNGDLVRFVLALTFAVVIFVVGVIWSPVPTEPLMYTMVLLAVLEKILYHLLRFCLQRNRATYVIETIGTTEVLSFGRNPWTKHMTLVMALGAALMACNILFISTIDLAIGQLVHDVWIR